MSAMPQGTQLWGEGDTGRGCLFRRASECSANDEVPGSAVILILSRLHPFPGLEGGAEGRRGGIRKVERWALGPHPARPGAWREQRPNGAVSSVRSPHPEASRGTAASLETGFLINRSYWINSRRLLLLGKQRPLGSRDV